MRKIELLEEEDSQNILVVYTLDMSRSGNLLGKEV